MTPTAAATQEDLDYQAFLAEHKASEQHHAAKRLLTGDNGKLYLTVLKELPESITEQSQLLPLILKIIKGVYPKAGDLEWTKSDACHVLGHLTQTAYITVHTNTLMNGSYATGAEYFYNRNKSFNEIALDLQNL